MLIFAMNYNEKILMILHIELYTLFNGTSTYHGVIEILFGVATLGVITEIAYLAPSYEKLFSRHIPSKYIKWSIFIVNMSVGNA